MASTQSAFPPALEGDGLGFAGKAAVVFNPDDLTAIYGPESASNNGLADKWSGAINKILLGNASSKLVGINNPKVKVATTGQSVIRNVTGVTGVGDVGKEVYAIDENTYTLTQPVSFVQPVGMVLVFLNGTTVVVRMYSFEHLRTVEKAACGQVRVDLGVIDAVSLANGNMLVDEPMGFHGHIETLVLRCQKVPTGAGAAATLKLQLKPAGGSYADVGAPATISAALADTLGLIKTAAVPLVLTGAGLNCFHDGDKIQVVASSVTAFTAGLYSLVALCRTRPGL